MPRVLITGMSGAGKSTLLGELRRRGRLTVDTDYDGWTQSDGTWDEARMNALLAASTNVIISGTADNQGRFYDRLDHVVLLSAPVETLIARVSTRADNPYGRTDQQQAQIRGYVAEVEPLLRLSADIELDGRLPVTELADAVDALA